MSLSNRVSYKNKVAFWLVPRKINLYEVRSLLVGIFSGILLVGFLGVASFKVAADENIVSRPKWSPINVERLSHADAGWQLVDEFSGLFGDSSYGKSVSYAGDVNGDGYPDVIVGEPYSNAGGITDAGRAYIYFGGPEHNNWPDVIFRGEYERSDFGRSVGYAGDVNGDGYADVIVGAPDSWGHSWGYSPGKAFIFFGGSHMDNIVDVEMEGLSPGMIFGWSARYAGDINNDGYDDVIVGGPSWLGDGTDEEKSGTVCLFLGGPQMSNTPALIINGEQRWSDFGQEVNYIGDVNSDGYADFAISALHYDQDGLADLGKVYVFFGGEELNKVPDMIILGSYQWNYYGESVSYAGDLNADGHDDFIVGTSHSPQDSGGFDIGKADVFFGGPLVDNEPDITFVGEKEDAYFGCSVSFAGDLNKDGFNDVIVGAHGFSYDFDSDHIGKAFIFFGGPTLDKIADEILLSGDDWDSFGFSVSYAGDFDNNGYDDVLVSADSKDKTYIFGMSKINWRLLK